MRQTSSELWSSFKEARTIILVAAAIAAGCAAIIAHYETVNALLSWTCILLSAASMTAIMVLVQGKTARVYGLVAIMIATAGAIWFVTWRQAQQENSYELSWLPDTHPAVAGENGADQNFAQVGLCFVNPNPFPVHVEVERFTFILEGQARDEKAPNTRSIAPPYSVTASMWQDPVDLNTVDAEIPQGRLLAMVKYGRDPGSLDKTLPIDAELHLILDERRRIRAVAIGDFEDAPPNGYELHAEQKIHRCDKTQGGLVAVPPIPYPRG